MVYVAGIGIGAFSVFLPSFIQEFGFHPLTTQSFSMISCAFGLASHVRFAWLSDRVNNKGAMTLFCMTITSTGFIILLSTTNKVALIAGACVRLSRCIPWIGYQPGSDAHTSRWIHEACHGSMDSPACAAVL